MNDVHEVVNKLLSLHREGFSRWFVFAVGTRYGSGVQQPTYSRGWWIAASIRAGADLFFHISLMADARCSPPSVAYWKCQSPEHTKFLLAPWRSQNSWRSKVSVEQRFHSISQNNLPLICSTRHVFKLDCNSICMIDESKDLSLFLLFDIFQHS